MCFRLVFYIILVALGIGTFKRFILIKAVVAVQLPLAIFMILLFTSRRQHLRTKLLAKSKAKMNSPQEYFVPLLLYCFYLAHLFLFCLFFSGRNQRESDFALPLPSGLRNTLATRRNAFLDFVSSTFCEENVLFLEEVMEMRRCRNSAAIGPIYHKYIQDGSPLQVNIDFSLKSSIAQKVSQRPADFTEEDLDVFDGAFDHVAKMVERDTVSKFQSVTGESSKAPQTRSASDEGNL